MLHRVLVLIVVSAGCAEGVQLLDTDGGTAPTPDAPPEGGDGSVTPPGDAPPPAGAARLLLTEIVLAPSTGELIEIANPSSAAVDLSAYYLADHGNYFRTPEGTVAVDSGDFVARFPTGASIPANGVITVSLDTAANFSAAYGAAPTYALGQMMLVTSSGTPTLTNGGELVVLFQWDGQSDVVRDVDMLLAGVPSVANGIVDKSGVIVDGPDADAIGTAYKVDARTLAPQPSAPASARSTKRLAPETGYETHGGTGNGLLGDDETSEDTAQTWDTTFTAPTPGTVPSGLM